MMKRLSMVAVTSIWMGLSGCGKNSDTAGAVIDTSTWNTQVQGRDVASLKGQWMRIEDSRGVVDSVQIDGGGALVVEYEPDQSLRLDAEALSYFAYRIIPTDTIRPSAPLRFLFPAHEAWDSLHPPQVVGWNAQLHWSRLHVVWMTDSLPAGRHLIRWSENGDFYQADLVLTEMANRFENHQATAPIAAGSLRPKDCGFASFVRNVIQGAGLGCPHTESDAFNHSGVSSADLLAWNDSLLRFQLVSLSNGGLTGNPYSKLMLEFGPNEETFDLASFDSLTVVMDLAEGDTLQVRLAQKNLAVGHWFYRDFGGRGYQEYSMPLDTNLRALNQTDTLKLDAIFGLEFRNARSGRAILGEVRSLRFH